MAFPCVSGSSCVVAAAKTHRDGKIMERSLSGRSLKRGANRVKKRPALDEIPKAVAWQSVGKHSSVMRYVVEKATSTESLPSRTLKCKIKESGVRKPQSSKNIAATIRATCMVLIRPKTLKIGAGAKYPSISTIAISITYLYIFEEIEPAANVRP